MERSYGRKYRAWEPAYSRECQGWEVRSSPSETRPEVKTDPKTGVLPCSSHEMFVSCLSLEGHEARSGGLLTTNIDMDSPVKWGDTEHGWLRAHLKRFKIIVCGWWLRDLRFGVKKKARNHQTDKNRKWKTRKERRGPLGNTGAIRPEVQNCINLLGLRKIPVNGS